MKGQVAQVIAAVLANLVMTSGGMLFGWSSPSLPLLLKGDSDLHLTRDQGSWVVSFLNFGCIFGPILAALIVDRIGRKWALCLAAQPIIISWVLIAFAPNYEWLCVARFIGGLGVGATFAITPMYLGEIAEDRIRGCLGTMMTTMVILGILISYTTGPWVSRQILALISAIPPLIFTITYFWIPETPYYFLIKGDREAANASLVWLRRKKEVQKELESMEHSIRLQQQNRTSFFELVTNSGNRKALLITIGLHSTHLFCGMIAIQSYASTIFEKSGFSFSSSVSVILMGVVKLTAGLFTVLTVDATGRRPLLIISSIGVTLFLLPLAVFYHLQALGYDVSAIAWIPLCSVLATFVMFTIGIGCLPNAIVGEMFPTNVKASATMLLTIYGACVGMIVTKLHQVVEDAFGIHVVFYSFAACTAVGLVFIVFCVPETKGRSLQDIQDLLKTSTPSKDTILNRL